MSNKKFKCPVSGCDRDAKYVGFQGEEILMPVKMPMSDLKRQPPLKELGRNFLVECPCHGLKIVQTIGHHITNIPKKSKKRK
jgi:hypothetical protein